MRILRSNIASRLLRLHASSSVERTAGLSVSAIRGGGSFKPSSVIDEPLHAMRCDVDKRCKCSGPSRVQGPCCSLQGISGSGCWSAFAEHRIGFNCPVEGAEVLEAAKRE